MNYADTVPVMTRNRGCGQKEQAAITRDLFKILGLKGISVTMPNGSMCFWVDVRLPGRLDYNYLRYLDKNWTMKADPGYMAQRWAENTIKAILARAFPNHNDRSDSQTDYFDNPWSIHFKSGFDYDPPKPRKSAGSKVEKMPGLDEKIVSRL